jgi:hypothetical protein
LYKEAISRLYPSTCKWVAPICPFFQQSSLQHHKWHFQRRQGKINVDDENQMRKDYFKVQTKSTRARGGGILSIKMVFKKSLLIKSVFLIL